MRYFILLSFIALKLYVFSANSTVDDSIRSQINDHYIGMNYFYEEVLPLDSTEAMNLLNELITDNAGIEKAVGYSWKGIYLHKKFPAEVEAAIHSMEMALELAENLKSSEWKIIASNYLGFFYLTSRKFEKGVEHLLMSDHMLQSAGYDKFYHAEQYLYHLARMYFEFSKYEQSIKYLEKALQYAEDGSKIKQLSLNLMGINYAETETYDKASQYLEQAKLRVVENSDSSGIAALNSNLGILYTYQEKFDKAEPLLKSAYSYNMRHENATSAATNLLWLSELHLQQDQLDISKEYLKQASSKLEQMENPGIELRGLYYRTASNFYEKSLQFKKAHAFLDSAHQLERKIMEQRDESMLSAVNFRLISEKHFYEVQLLEKQKEHEAFIRNMILVFSVLIMGVLFYLWYSNYLRRKKEEKLHYEEQRKNLAELENFKKRIRLQNNTIENVKKQLIELKSENAEAERTKNRLHQELANSIILTEEDWQRFKSLFEKAHPDFLDKVQNEFPDLTNAEIRLLALLKMNLSITEMANMLAILPESVRKTRQRLMKKLEISYHKELRNFIKEI